LIWSVKRKRINLIAIVLIHAAKRVLVAIVFIITEKWVNYQPVISLRTLKPLAIEVLKISLDCISNVVPGGNSDTIPKSFC